jgi:hypothetical protein
MFAQGGPVRSINRGFPYLGRGCIVFLAVVAITMSELYVSTTSSASSEVSSVNIVDRTTKGDRLPLVPTLPLKNTKRSGLNHPLPVGCKGVVSYLAHFPSMHIARRCLS